MTIKRITSQSLIHNPVEAILWQVRKQLKPQPKATFLDLSQPYNMYLVSDQAQSYLDLMEDKAYRTAFHDPVKNLIREQAARMFRNTHEPLALVDLGPGYPDKTVPLFEFLNASRVLFTYLPVDINSNFLELAAQTARSQGVTVLPLNVLFEELSYALPPALRSIGSRNAVILFGLTFMNYSRSRAAGLLKTLGLNGERLVVATELRRLANSNDLLRPYSTAVADSFNFQVLRLLGLNRTDFEYQVRFAKNRIEMGFRSYLEIALERDDLVIQKDTFIQTAVSYRYTINEFRDLLNPLYDSVDIVLDGTAHVALAIMENNLNVKKKPTT